MSWEWVKNHKARSLACVLGALLLLEVFYLWWLWPDWQQLSRGKPPKSRVIATYESRKKEDPKLPPLRWYPQAGVISKSISRVFLVAEDHRFYGHSGFDLWAIKEAMAYNWSQGSLALGASTISQQTAKNLFLSLARTPWRKFHEVIFTILLENFLEKERILQIYLNIVEFGRGVYGLEAAARIYFNVSAAQLSRDQAAALAATLPSPRRHNPRTQTRAFLKRKERILSALRIIDPPPLPPADMDDEDEDDVAQEEELVDQPPMPVAPTEGLQTPAVELEAQTPGPLLENKDQKMQSPVEEKSTSQDEADPYGELGIPDP